MKMHILSEKKLAWIGPTSDDVEILEFEKGDIWIYTGITSQQQEYALMYEVLTKFGLVWVFNPIK